mmetsp:Transcript_10392/g.32417  ORF Transcript_10392/g.32417 Transcript_10392/m.32417 type:complete len:215 (-) Transcript_10392:293-937(-)
MQVSRELPPYPVPSVGSAPLPSPYPPKNISGGNIPCKASSAGGSLPLPLPPAATPGLLFSLPLPFACERGDAPVAAFPADCLFLPPVTSSGAKHASSLAHACATFEPVRSTPPAALDASAAPSSQPSSSASAPGGSTAATSTAHTVAVDPSTGTVSSGAPPLSSRLCDSASHSTAICSLSSPTAQNLHTACRRRHARNTQHASIAPHAAHEARC